MEEIVTDVFQYTEEIYQWDLELNSPLTEVNGFQ